MHVQIEITIDEEKIDNLLCSALDPGYGGAYYWCSAERDPSHPGEKAEYLHEVPLKGGTLIIKDDEDDGKTYKLDRKAIKKGLEAMATWGPDDGARHFADVISGDIDSDTADAFLQACCFGKLIYG